MNDLLKSRLEILAQDELTLAAISALINERIEKEKPTIDGDDTTLGQKFRAYESAKEMLRGFFIDIETFKNKKEADKGFSKEQ